MFLTRVIGCSRWTASSIYVLRNKTGYSCFVLFCFKKSLTEVTFILTKLLIGYNTVTVPIIFKQMSNLRYYGDHDGMDDQIN